jgi:DNA-binding cell septation regulator SpoVG
MFSYSFKIRKINTPSKLKAFVSITIDDVMEVDGFKIIDGSNGLFVSAPSHKGTVMEDGVKVEKYFDDVKFLGEEGIAVSNEIKQAIINQYTSEANANPSSGGASRAAAAKAQSKLSSPSPSAPSARKEPLWGF